MKKFVCLFVLVATVALFVISSDVQQASADQKIEVPPADPMVIGDKGTQYYVPANHDRPGQELHQVIAHLKTNLAIMHIVPYTVNGTTEGYHVFTDPQAAQMLQELNNLPK